MSGPKERQKQFSRERDTKLKPRDNANKNGNAKESAPKVENEVKEKQKDACENSAITDNHAKQVREYRKRQKYKLKGRKHPRARGEDNHNHIGPQGEIK